MKKNLKSQNKMEVANCDLQSGEHSRSKIATLNKDGVVTNCDHLQDRILTIRGKCVMVDRDLAVLYKVTTKALNQAIKRNIERFPVRFRFQLTDDEKSEVVTNCDHLSALKFSYAPVYAFTEQGVAMLATVLKSDIAVKTSIEIMDAFVAMRKFMMASAGVLQRLGAIEIKQLEADKKFATVFDALDRGNLLPQGILETGAEFDAFRFVTRLMESAKREIVLIDPYADASTLEVLAKKAKGVNVRLICKATNWSKPTATEIAKFNKQYKGLTVERSDNFHDRFVIIDGTELYNLGSSVNSLGRRLTTYTTRDPKEIAKVLANV